MTGGYLEALHLLRRETSRKLSAVKVCTQYALGLLVPVKKKKLRGLSPRANYTDRAAAAGRRS